MGNNLSSNLLSIIPTNARENSIGKYVFAPPNCCGDNPSYIKLVSGKGNTLSYYESGTTICSATLEPTAIRATGNCQVEKIIVYSHGNGTSLCINTFIDKIDKLASQLNVIVYAYDYFGYGWSQNKDCSIVPTELGCYESLDLLLNTLYLKGYARENIILMGESLGCGPAVEFACREEFNKLILFCPFTSTVSIMMNLPILMFFDLFQNIEKIHKVKCFTKIVHGLKDEVIPVDHTYQLNRKIPIPHHSPPLIVEDAFHNNLLCYREVITELRRLSGL